MFVEVQNKRFFQVFVEGLPLSWFKHHLLCELLLDHSLFFEFGHLAFVFDLVELRFLHYRSHGAHPLEVLSNNLAVLNETRYPGHFFYMNAGVLYVFLLEKTQQASLGRFSILSCSERSI